VLGDSGTLDLKDLIAFADEIMNHESLKKLVEKLKTKISEKIHEKIQPKCVPGIFYMYCGLVVMRKAPRKDPKLLVSVPCH